MYRINFSFRARIELGLPHVAGPLLQQHYRDEHMLLHVHKYMIYMIYILYIHIHIHTHVYIYIYTYM